LHHRRAGRDSDWLLYMFGQALDTCGNKIEQTINYPDGAFRAVVFERDCGATTGFSTQISMLARGDELRNKGGNAFDADDKNGAPPAPRGGPMVHLKWTGLRNLEIHYDRFAHVFRKQENVNGITIRFVPDL
jgi:hypothetical protein